MKHLVILAALLLTACGGRENPLIKTEYVEVKTPVHVVPAPPDYAKHRPKSFLEALTPEQRKDIGYLIEGMTLDSKSKDTYIQKLELILNKYKDESAKNKVSVPPLAVPELDSPQS